jgi:hypothetical protein
MPYVLDSLIVTAIVRETDADGATIREISAQPVKLFRAAEGDVWAWATAQLKQADAAAPAPSPSGP